MAETEKFDFSLEIREYIPEFAKDNLCEIFDKSKIAEIIISNNYGNEPLEWLTGGITEAHLLTKMYKNYDHKKGYISTKFRHNSDNKFGRVYERDNATLGALSRVNRSYICGDLYYDFDMENCHYNLINSVIKYYSWNDLDHIQDYINNREDKLRKVVDFHKVDRKQAKQLYLRLMYGGTYEGWLMETFNIDYKTAKSKLKLKDINDIQKDINFIKDKIVDANPKMIELAKQQEREHPDRSVLSWFNQGIEVQVIDVVYKALKKKKIIKRFNRHRNAPYVCIPCFDGIMIFKKHIDGLYSIDTVKNIMENAIVDFIDYKIPIENKPFERVEYCLDVYERIPFDEIEDKIMEFYARLHNNGIRTDINEKGVRIPTSIDHDSVARYIYNTYHDNFIVDYRGKIFFIKPFDSNNIWEDTEMFDAYFENLISVNIYKTFSEIDDADNLKNVSFRKNIVNGLKTIIQVEKPKKDNIVMNKSPHLNNCLVFKNGVLDLDTGILRDIEKGDYITMTLDYEWYEHDFINDEVNKKVYDKVINTIKQIMPDERDRSFLCSFMRYMITGYTDLQYFMFAYGATACNGKSTILKLLQKALPMYYTDLPSNFFYENFNKTHKYLKDFFLTPIRICGINEISVKKTDIEKFKTFITESKFKVDIMYENTAEIHLLSKLFITSNKAIDAGDKGFIRRALTLPFKSQFVSNKEEVNEEDDKYLMDRNLENLFNQDIYKRALITMLMGFSHVGHGAERLDYKEYIEKYATELQENTADMIEDPLLDLIKECFDFKDKYARVDKDVIINVLKDNGCSVDLNKAFGLRLLNDKIRSMGVVYKKNIKGDNGKNGVYKGLRVKEEYMNKEKDYACDIPAQDDY